MELRRPTSRAKWAFGVAAALLGSLVGSTPAGAQETLAASCAGPRDGYDARSPTDRSAQTFITGLTGGLTRAQIDFSEPPAESGDYVVQILAVDGTGTPTDTVLSQTAVAELPPGPATLDALFAAPASVVAGQAYGLALTRPTGNIAWGYRANSADCPGKFFFQTFGTGPWDGTTYDRDQLFSVFVTPPSTEPQPQPQPKADRTLTLETGRGRVEKGHRVRISGGIDAPQDEAGCEPGQSVELQRTAGKDHAAAFETFATLESDAAGGFSARVRIRRTRVYRAVVAESELCDASVSNTEKVRVKKDQARSAPAPSGA